jgi:hypothetical protein
LEFWRQHHQQGYRASTEPGPGDHNFRTLLDSCVGQQIFNPALYRAAPNPPRRVIVNRAPSANQHRGLRVFGCPFRGSASFQAADLIKMLGIGSVAIGFAFQNILQNFLAGILLLVNEPFQLGDLISVTGIEGNVDDIQARATVVTTKEGRQVVIPNAVLFTNPVAVARGGATQQ